MGNVSDKFVEKITAHFFFPENHAVYVIVWKKYGRARQITSDDLIRRLRSASRIIKAGIQTHNYNT